MDVKCTACLYGIFQILHEVHCYSSKSTKKHEHEILHVELYVVYPSIGVFEYSVTCL